MIKIDNDTKEVTSDIAEVKEASRNNIILESYVREYKTKKDLALLTCELHNERDDLLKIVNKSTSYLLPIFIIIIICLSYYLGTITGCS